MSFPYVHELETRTLLSEYQGKKDARTLKSWCDEGGYQRVRKVIEMSPETITDVVKESGFEVEVEQGSLRALSGVSCRKKMVNLITYAAMRTNRNREHLKIEKLFVGLHIF